MFGMIGWVIFIALPLIFLATYMALWIKEWLSTAGGDDSGPKDFAMTTVTTGGSTAGPEEDGEKQNYKIQAALTAMFLPCVVGDKTVGLQQQS